MSRVFAEMSISLDGFITGPDHSLKLPLGRGGEKLHEWIYQLASWRELHGLDGGEQNPEAELLAAHNSRTGAVILGKTMFDHGSPFWGEEPPFHIPVFILTTESLPPEVKRGGTTYTFVKEGIEAALRLAKEAAGTKDVKVAGGAKAIQQFLRAGLLDEILISQVPILLGGGERLFNDLEDSIASTFINTEILKSAEVIHLRYDIQHD
ncbi:dihydrofolate reductase family protein [Paenibacillus sp. JCM 10914]|uniref:dihydrofolate reductase family protein n=1 Tax=Paenibacillus sp. JCM 10914 TaxID=1236974 RepID=UPI0003CC39F9|nr:dihydrofolate reductase family protein [Paenibacillus sp. JCM 10914]GAE05142.1 bifunctional deaminase-reductase domain protein [Paenibacillus sp. JCM 10914]